MVDMALTSTLGFFLKMPSPPNFLGGGGAAGGGFTGCESFPAA